MFRLNTKGQTGATSCSPHHLVYWPAKSGKSALADALAVAVQGRGFQVELINSGRMRKTPLGASLGFSKDDRDTNVRRHARSQPLVKNGVVAIVSAVSPYANTRAKFVRGSVLCRGIRVDPEGCLH